MGNLCHQRVIFSLAAVSIVWDLFMMMLIGGVRLPIACDSATWKDYPMYINESKRKHIIRVFIVEILFYFTDYLFYVIKLFADIRKNRRLQNFFIVYLIMSPILIIAGIVITSYHTELGLDDIPYSIKFIMNSVVLILVLHFDHVQRAEAYRISRDSCEESSTLLSH